MVNVSAKGFAPKKVGLKSNGPFQHVVDEQIIAADEALALPDRARPGAEQKAGPRETASRRPRRTVGGWAHAGAPAGSAPAASPLGEPLITESVIAESFITESVIATSVIDESMVPPPSTRSP